MHTQKAKTLIQIKKKIQNTKRSGSSSGFRASGLVAFRASDGHVHGLDPDPEVGAVVVEGTIQEHGHGVGKKHDGIAGDFDVAGVNHGFVVLVDDGDV